MLIFSAIGIGALIYAALALVTAAVIPWMEMVDLKNAAGQPESWRTGAMIKQALGGADVYKRQLLPLSNYFKEAIIVCQ